MVDLILFQVALVDIFGGHSEGLGEGDEKVEEVDDFDACVLLIDLLVFGPPFPRETIDEFGQLLAHGAGVVEGPFCFVVWRERGEVHPDLFIEEVLHAEDFVELIGCGHREWVAGGARRRRLFYKKRGGDVKKSGSELDGGWRRG